MEKANIQGGLRSLSESLRKIRTTLEWIALKRNEQRPGDPPPVMPNDPLFNDLRTEVGWFLKTASDLHEILNNRVDFIIPSDTRESWRHHLLKREAELNLLDLPKTL